MLIIIKLTTGLALILSFILGIYTFILNSKMFVYRLWFLTCMAVVIWTGGYLLTITSNSSESAVFYLKIVYVGATLIPILFFHFILKFLSINKKILLSIGYITLLVLLYLFIFTDSIIIGSNYLNQFGYYEKISEPVFYLYLLYFLFYTVFAVFYCLKKYTQADGFKKRQILYIVWAAIIGFGGGMSNFVMALTGWYPVGQFFVFLYPILITYGIFLPNVRVRM